jgi:ribonucleotide monophosphatase NagD (HAD superfamily)
MIRAIIFDWGGVLVDAETKAQYPDALALLEHCQKKKYRMVLACIASKYEDRKKQIDESNLRHFFEFVQLEPMPAEKIWDPAYNGKDIVFDKVNNYLKLPAEEVLIIDDRTVRGIRYANQHAHSSVWVQQGKFAHELPNEITGQPTFIAHSTAEAIQFI